MNTNTTSATEPRRSPEALHAAREFGRQTFTGGDSYARFIDALAFALDDLARAQVERERERCAAACNPLLYGATGEDIRSRIVKGWQP